MKVSARLRNSVGGHAVILATSDCEQSLAIPPKAKGPGSSVSGGELLCLALATCYCNDVYREAAKRRIAVEQVEVEVQGEFGAEGEAAKNVTHHVRVAAQASDEGIRDLLRQTDRVAEIQNTLRTGTPVALASIEIDRGNRQ